MEPGQNEIRQEDESRGSSRNNHQGFVKFPAHSVRTGQAGTSPVPLRRDGAHSVQKLGKRDGCVYTGCWSKARTLLINDGSDKRRPGTSIFLSGDSERGQ